jgi:hypothetical protein
VLDIGTGDGVRFSALAGSFGWGFGIDSDPEMVRLALQPGGHFITQQVGERNMACVREALGLAATPPPITPGQVADAGLMLISFREYDVEYVVRDIESLVFWLTALDLLHADLNGSAALAGAGALNAVLAGNVSERGFITNEHRYLVVARLPARE